MNYIMSFFKNAAVDTAIGIAFAIAAFIAGIALSAQQAKTLRNFRDDLVMSNLQVKVEYVKVPVSPSEKQIHGEIIDLGEFIIKGR